MSIIELALARAALEKAAAAYAEASVNDWSLLCRRQTAVSGLSGDELRLTEECFVGPLADSERRMNLAERRLVEAQRAYFA